MDWLLDFRMLMKKLYILIVLICAIFKVPETFAQVVLEADNSLNNTNKNYLLDFDKVWGEGLWERHALSTPGADSAIDKNIKTIYITGNRASSSIRDYLSLNKEKLERWVLEGGVLYITIYDASQNIDLIGNIKVISGARCDSAYIVDAAHPAFSGPHQPIPSAFKGYNSFNVLAYGRFEGAGLKPLLINKRDSTSVILAEKSWGNGKIIVSALNSFIYLLPFNHAQNFHRNLLEIKRNASMVSANLDFQQVHSCIGSQDVSISITNNGSTSLNNAIVNWDVNGELQQAFQVPGSIAPGTPQSGSNIFKIGSLSFNQYADYNIKAWVTVAGNAGASDTSYVTVRPAMAGTYTVGTGEDFTSVQAAVTSLNQNGVCGPVTFKIKPGTYSQGLVFTKIKGASEINTITFEPENGDSTSVTIINNLTSSSSNVVVFNGTSHVIFKKLILSVGGTSTSYGTVINLTNGASHLTFENNRINGRPTTSTGVLLSPVYFVKSNIQDVYFGNITFKNNVINNGSYGIYNYNNSKSPTDEHIRIEGNRISGSTAYGIYLSDQRDLVIHKNTITLSANGASGIYLSRVVGGSTISSNYIKNSGNGTGIVVAQSSFGNSSVPGIFNNGIRMGGTTIASKGINLISASDINISFNSIRIESDLEASNPFLGSRLKNIKFLNNIFYARGSAAPLAITFTGLDTADLVLNKNVYFSKGKHQVIVDQNGYGLSAWQAFSKNDPNSIHTNPLFVAETDFLPNNKLLEGSGVYQEGVQTDLNGAVRNQTQPDIGAMEFTTTGTKLSIGAVELPQAPFLPGSYPVKVSVDNTGSAAVLAFSIVCKVNDQVMGVKEWNQSLASGSHVIVPVTEIQFEKSIAYTIAFILMKDGIGIDSVKYSNIYTALPAGNYTIGGTDPDFTSFRKVIQTLNNGGIGGSVNFLIRDGQYSERVALENVQGASQNNRITFQSESGDSSKVMMAISSRSDSNYVFRISNTGNVTVKGLTFQITGTYGGVILLQNNYNGTRIENNRMNAGSSYSSYYAINASSGQTAPSSLLVQNNSIFNSGAIYIGGTDSISEVVIKGNVIQGQVNLTGNRKLLIENNRIKQQPSQSYITGLYFENYKGVARILKNDIQVVEGHGVYFKGSGHENASNKIILANNYIRCKGPSGSQGIYLETSKHIAFYNNTIHTSVSGSSTIYFYGTCPGVEFYNNNLINTGKSNVFYFGNSTAHEEIKSDNNNLYTNGTSLIYSYVSYNHPDNNLSLAKWISLRDKDHHSLSVDPGLITDSSYIFSNKQLVGKGKYLSAVTEDITGKTRRIPSDIGASEYVPTGKDLGIIGLVTSGISGSKERSLKIIVRNYGLQSASSFSVDWTINGAEQIPYMWTGSLPSLKQDTILLGSVNINTCSSVTFTFKLLQTPDDSPENDTLSVSNFTTPLAGTYTIGGSNPDFTTFTQAVTCLKRSGISGKVVFKVRPDTYLEQIALSKIKGASEDNTVTFSSESGDSTSVILSFYASSSNNYTLLLDTCSYVRFTSMTIRSEHSTYGVAILLKNGSNYNIFSNCRIEGPSSYTGDLIYLDGTPYSQQYNTFDKNLILNGGTGISVNYSSYQSITLATGNSVTNNTFKNQKSIAIYSYGQKEFMAIGNTIETSSTETSSGIDITTAYPFTILNNKINILKGGRGITANSGSSTEPVRSLIANNFIRIYPEKASSGIALYGGRNILVAHNTVLLGPGIARADALYMNNVADCDVLNNILINKGFGAAFKAESNNSNLSLDHNNIFSAIDLPIFYNNDSYTLEKYQKTTGLDSNSISRDVVFKNEQDLHTIDPVVRGRGKLIAQIDTDIDGQLRKSLPDIGADEYFALESDLAIHAFSFLKQPVTVGENDITLTMANNGNSPLTAFKIEWSVNDTLKPAMDWSGALNPGEIKELALGTHTFEQGKKYSVKAWIVNANDSDISNDTIIEGPFYTALSGVYSIGNVPQADFQTLNQALNALNQSGVAGPVTFNVSEGVFEEQLSFGYIKGASEVNTITFSGAESFGTELKPIINASQNNYAIKIDKGRFLNFEKLHFVSSAAYGRAVRFENSGTNITFRNNKFSGNKSDVIIEFGSGDTFEENVFAENIFIDGSIGINFSSSGRNNKVLFNRFANQSSSALRLSYQGNITLKGNSIKSPESATSYRAILVENADGYYSIERNSIIVRTGQAGIQLTGNATGKLLLANNFISASGNTITSAVSIATEGTQEIYHNTIQVNSASVNAVVLRLTGTVRVRSANNILLLKNEGTALFADNSVIFDYSDYNNFYASVPSGKLFNSRPTFNDWKIFRNLDWNSVSLDPLFSSDSTWEVGEIQLNRLGIGIPAVTEDIEGDRRNSKTPSIGADETAPKDDDAGVQSLAGVSKPLKEGNSTIYAVIRNYGDNELNSVTIKGTVNDSLFFNKIWLGTLASGDTTLTELGNYSFANDQKYVLKVWTERPNGTTDNHVENDLFKTDTLITALQGYYTIGGNAPHFNNLTKAVADLDKRGIIDSVVFNIRPGIYEEQIVIPSIVGSASAGSIVFQPESGKADDVTIRFSGTKEKNYLVKLDGGDGISFRNLRFEAGNDDYGTLIHLIHGAHNITFEGNKFIGTSITSTGSWEKAMIYATYNLYNNNQLAIRNNEFLNGSYGVLLSGQTSGDLVKDLIIRNNRFVNQQAISIGLTSMENAEVSFNEIVSEESGTQFKGIQAAACYKNSKVVSNKLILKNGGTGIYAYEYDQFKSQPGLLVANNFISVSGNSCIGIENTSGYISRYVHNSIYINSASVNTRNAGLLLSGTSLTAQNNCIVAAGTAYCVNFTTLPFRCDYNNYYGGNVGYTGNIKYPTLSEWQNVTKLDFNSSKLNPGWISTTDLHASNALLAKSVPSLPLVQLDIDGDIRDTLTAPGADEFNPKGADAALKRFVSPVLPFESGFNEIKVVLVNNGTDTLRNVTFDWAFNNVRQNPLVWNGSLKSKDSVIVDLGKYEFLSGTNYALKVWTHLPNGTQDLIQINDTLYSGNLLPAMSGIYTIGGTSPDFVNFSQAVNALHARGVSGKVTFKVREGIYNEQLVLNKIAGVSENNAITFESEVNDSSAVTIAYKTAESSNYVVLLNGVNYVTFRDMTLRSTGNQSYQNYYGAVMSLREGASHNTIENCLLVSFNYSTTNGGRTVVNASEDSDNNTFVNNTFVNGTYAINLTGRATSYKTNRIENNRILNQQFGGIRLSYQSNTTVWGNTISSLVNDLNYKAISLENSKGNEIFANKITIRSQYSTGIYIYTISATASQPLLVYNNFIDNSTSGETYGIFARDAQHLKVYFNTVRLTGKTTNTAACGILFSSGASIQNNIFAHLNEGMALYLAGTGINSNYNNLYTNGPLLCQWGSSSTKYASLEEYVAASGLDNNSISIDPLFKGPDDLHITQVHLDGAGTPIAGITDDIDGHLRNATRPDMGADEFGAGLHLNDIGVTSLIAPVSACDMSNVYEVKVRLQNYGVDTISKFGVAYRVNGGIPVIETVESFILYPGKTSVYTFKTPVDLTVRGQYIFDVYTVLSGDTVNRNDSLLNIVVQHYPAVTVKAMNDTIVCQGQRVRLQASGAHSYEWYYQGSSNPFSTGNSFYQEVGSNRVLVVKGFSEFNCHATDTATIRVKPKPSVPVISRSGESSRCKSDTIYLFSDIKKSIFWSTGQSTASIAATKSGNYSVTHIDSVSGCTSSASIYVGKPASPRATVSNNNICPGQSSLLKIEGSGIKSVLWSTGEKTSSLTVQPQSTTTYTVDVETEEGCTYAFALTVSVKSAMVFSPEIFSVTVLDSAVCPGTPASVKVHARGEDYSWAENGIEKEFTYTPTKKTTYTINVKGGTCSEEVATARFTIDVLPEPARAPIIVATGAKSLSLCEADSIILNSSDYNENIIWSTGDTSQSIKVLQHGIYSVSHVNSYGCMKTASVKIDNPPTPYITGNTEICEGESTRLSVINGNKFLWSTGDTTSSIVVTPQTSTKYSVKVEILEGCTYYLSTEVTFKQLPRITAISADTTICKGQEVTLQVSGTATDFLWSDGQKGATVKVRPDKTTIYSVKATNSCNKNPIEDFQNMTVTVLPVPVAPVINHPDSVYICKGTSILLMSDVKDSIRWSTGQITSEISLSDTGKVYLTRFNQYSCVTLDSVQILYPSKPLLKVGGRGFSTICKGDTAILSISGVKNSFWTTGASTSSITTVPYQTTVYHVSGSDIYGCAYSDSIEITVIEPQSPVVPANMLPSSQNVSELPLPLQLSWAPSNHASKYHVYIWESSLTKPDAPFASGIDQIGLVIKDKQLAYGKTYYWQIEALNSCKQTEGPVEQFSIRALPDLVVQNVLTPASAFSGQQILVSWEVKNIGKGNTVTTESWYDGIYLSADSIFDPNLDRYITGVVNKTALDTGKAYLSSATITLPKGIAGTYYIFVESNKHNGLVEAERSNNMGRNTRYMLVNLTPSPDFQVTQVIVPFNSFSGQEIDVRWTVQNKGKGVNEERRWSDRIFLSKDSIFKSGQAVELKTIEVSEILDPGVSYERVTKAKLPLEISGKYFIHVLTDAKDQVYEYAFNNNNSLTSSALEIILLPPSDLIPVNVTFPSPVSNLEKVTISWTVKNQGGSETNTQKWRDNIYLSKDLQFNEKNAKLLGSKTYYKSLKIDSSYTQSVEVNIPSQISGPYYIFVQTDKDNEVFEYKNEDNNIYRSSTLMTINNADIVVENLHVLNDTVKSGERINLQWIVKNNGKGIVSTTNWTDSLYLSLTSDPYDKENIALGRQMPSVSKSLAQGDTILLQGSFVVPEGVHGNYCLILKINSDNNLFEGTSPNANNISTKSVNILLSPWADLVVTGVKTDSSSLTAGDTLKVAFTVANKGNATAKKSQWVEGLYLSSYSKPGEKVEYVGGVTSSGSLSPGDSNSYNVSIAIDPTLKAGDYYLHVHTDATNSIFEHTNETNNISVYGPLTIKASPQHSLLLAHLETEDTLNTAIEYSFQWKVTNTGQKHTGVRSWNDVLFLSKDTLIQSGIDLKLTTVANYKGLAPDSSYSKTGGLNIPDGMIGNYYLIMLSNYDSKMDSLYNKPGSHYFNARKIIPVRIQQSTTPDLQVSSLSVPSFAKSGQPITINYSVTNLGAGATRPFNWTDKFYLSTDFVVQKDKDILVGTINRTSTLEPGKSYADSVRLNIPANVSGNYILIAYTDETNKQFEAEYEDNNTAYRPLTIERPLPSDLVVSAVQFPEKEYLNGSYVDISWTLSNQGTNPANGYAEDHVYLSTDTEWDVNDVLLVNYGRNLNVAPLSSVTVTRKVMVQQVPFGNYYVIVKSDARNNIFETNDQNNTAVSAAMMKVDVREMFLNKTEITTLQNNVRLYYKITIPDSLAGETMLVSLNADEVQSVNELYISYEAAPDRNKYEAAFSKPFFGDQEVIIPKLKAGTYYVMAYGYHRLQINQDITLKAEILPFEIRSVETNRGGDAGMVTTCIQGAKFTDQTRFKLVGDDTVVDAVKLYFINSSKVFVTFRMDGVPTGFYDVVAEEPLTKERALYLNGFTVEKSTGYKLETDLEHPDQTTLGRIVPIHIYYANGGNIDIPTPERAVISLTKVPVAKTVEDLGFNLHSLLLRFEEPDGPSDILRPGVAGAITIYTKAIRHITLKIIK